MMRQRHPEFSDEIIERIKREIREEAKLTRRQLSLRVCEWLNWRCPAGRLQQMSCRVRLLKLHRSRVIELPEPTRRFAPPSPKPRQSLEPPPLEPLGCRIGELGAVELVPVPAGDRELLSIHKSLIETYHYLGTSGLCGAQLRYLVRCKHGWIGALSFSAAALQCAPRDSFIGWSVRARRLNRQRVVGNSRFLIRPQVKVDHLASHILGRALRRIGRDWRETYGIEPVLVETFVDPQRFEGTCYRAANWVEVGLTTGRGRQNRDRRKARSPKKVLLYGLDEDFRKILSELPAEPLVPLAVQEAAREDWSQREFEGARLNDRRLNRRLVVLAERFSACPGEAIPAVCHGKAETMAAYNFIDNEKTSLPGILASHYEASARRCAAEELVLCPQDTTFLNYTAHSATEGLGPIGHSKQTLQGLVVHDTLAMSEQGVPLGLIDLQCWPRKPEEAGKKHRRKKLPIEQKESCKWLKSYEAACALQARAPETMVVSVGDREADIYELFERFSSRDKPAHLLVRSQHNRLLAEGQGRLREALAKEPAQLLKIELPRSGSRKARTATVQVRWRSVELKAVKKDQAPIALWAIHAVERNTPAGVKAIEWTLLSSVPTESFQDACQRIKWYCKRWGIEVYHRTIKSGCRIEQRQARTADRLEVCLAIDAVVAWRVMLLTMLARTQPQASCESFFSDEQWQALFAFCRQVPKGVPTLMAATLLVAKLGGFLGRKSDGFPGCKSLWRGLEKLDTIVEAWQMFGPPTRIVPRDPEYG